MPVTKIVEEVEKINFIEVIKSEIVDNPGDLFAEKLDKLVRNQDFLVLRMDALLRRMKTTQEILGREHKSEVGVQVDLPEHELLILKYRAE